ncbi:MAG: hypothetical protein WKF37_08350 [Bryobacteraceae bacterium]
MVIEAGGVPGSPKFAKLKSELVNKTLDAKPKKPPVEEEPPVPIPPPPPTQGRRAPHIT